MNLFNLTQTRVQNSITSVEIISYITFETFLFGGFMMIKTLYNILIFENTFYVNIVLSCVKNDLH